MALGYAWRGGSGCVLSDALDGNHSDRPGGAQLFCLAA